MHFTRAYIPKPMFRPQHHNCCGTQELLECPTVYLALNRSSRISSVANASYGFVKKEHVHGRVIAVDRSGATVLVGGKVEAYLPVQEGPWILDNSGRGQAMQDMIPLGLEREFALLGDDYKLSPEAAENETKRLLVSARDLDKDILWKRMEQMHQLSIKAKENFKIIVSGANMGGLTAMMGGLHAFVPVSQLKKKVDGSWWTREEMEDSFVGKEVTVAVLEVDASENKIVCSIIKAMENDRLRSLEVGALVQGTVRRLERFGAFVGIKGTRISGLLHISNISRHTIGRPEDIFKIGEKISCILLAIDENYSNISLSTAELEVEDGDMLRDKQRVWSTAEQQAAQFCQDLTGDAL